MNKYICPLIVDTFAYKFHTLNITCIMGHDKNAITCPIIVITFVYKFHTLNVTTIIEQM